MKDNRYKITVEHTGDLKPRFVVRFAYSRLADFSDIKEAEKARARFVAYNKKYARCISKAEIPDFLARADIELNILSIDAVNDGDGWSWNDWHKVGTVSADSLEWSTRQTLAYFRNEGYLCEGSQGQATVEDDQYNIVICERYSRRPLFAIEYGAVFN